MAEVKYLDKTGLTSVWSKVKGIVTPKADKVSGATAGHLAGLNSSGNLTDSGLPASNIAQKDGSYSGMTVGAAEDLVSAESVASEFTSRITGGSTAVGKGGTALLDRIKGRTLVWNQLENGTWTSIYTMVKSGNTYTLSGTTSNVLTMFYSKSFISGHKYLVRAHLKINRETSISGYFYPGYFSSPTQWIGYAISGEGLRSGVDFKNIITADSNKSQLYLGVYHQGTTSDFSASDTVVVSNPQVYDLTLMFGAGNEPDTPEGFEAIYPGPYYAYHPGKLINNGLQSEYDLVWNQLVNNGDFSNSSTGWSATGPASLSVISKVASITTTGQYGVVTNPVTIVDGHKYYFAFSAKLSDTNLTFRGGVGNSGYFSTEGLMIPIAVSSTSETKRFSIISQYNKNASSGAYTSIIFMDISSSTHGTLSISNVVLFDLTTMFGAGNEPSTVAEFEAMFPNDYYAYDTGTEQHFSFPQFKTKIETVGWNIWDEEWEVGFYYISTGLRQAASDSIRSKNKMKVFPNTAYYCTKPSGKTLYIYFYTADGTYIGETHSGSSFTTPTNAAYINMAMPNLSPAVYGNDICISLSDPSRNGTYEPYWRSELELGLGDIKVKSHNLWDEEWEAGIYDSTTGEKATYALPRIRSKNYIPITPNKTYYFKSSNDLAVCWYDSNYQFIGRAVLSQNTTYSFVSNARYIAFHVGADLSTYNHDICINLSDTAFNGRYEPYGDGGVISITGGLKSAGTVYDEISGGKLVKRIESVDMGSMTWSSDTYREHTRFFSALADSKTDSSVYQLNNQINSYGYISTPKVVADNTVNLGLSKYNNNIYIRNDAYEGNDGTVFKAAMSGVPLYYELATPIEYELADAIPTAMRNDPYGTERRLPEDTAAIVTAPFRADITYSTNIKEAVQSLPQNYININSMQDFLAALGTLMGGTWTMRPADGKFDFTFTPNPSNE